MRRSQLLLQGVAAIVAGALALFVAPSASAEDAELILPVTINTVPHGETPAIIAGTDVYVPVTTLERAGLTGPMWERLQLAGRLRGAERTIGNERAVSLANLAPLATFVFDEANLTLAVTVKPELLQRRELSITSSRPADISYRSDRGGFLNYAVTSTEGKRTSGFGEAAFTAGPGLLYSAFSQTPDEGFVRGLTNFTYDQRTMLRRWTAGDAPVFSDELGGAGIVGGFTVARSFDIDPYFIRYPSLSLRGLAATPSQVDVYVNGVLVSRQTVEPGPFDIQNLPGVAGPTAAQIVVRDVFGREQTQSSSFYYSTAILGRGVRDYVYSGGFVRDDLRENFEYGTPVLLAYHRYGITERMTIGGRVEATDEVVSLGSSVSFGSRIADLDLKVAGSSGDGGRTGSAAQLSVRRLARRANVAVALRSFSRDYENFSLHREMDRALFEVALNGAYLAKWGNLGMTWSKARMRDNGDQRRLTFLSNIPIIQSVDLLLSASSVTGDRTGTFTEYFAGFSLHRWPRNTVNLGATRSGGQNLVTAEVQQPLTIGDSWGYRLQTTSGAGGTNGNASIQYQNRFGRYEVFSPLRDGAVTASLAGGVVFQGGRVIPARPVTQSFALVRVPGVENVRVYLSNQLIGRTDSHGDVLVPNLLSYYGNRISIDDRDVPMNYDVQVIEQTIAPMNRGGALVAFPVRAIRSITGNVSIRKPGGAALVPAYGQLTVESGGKSFESPLGAAGEFYLENITPGSYRSVVEYETGSCTFSLSVPESKTEIIELGTLVCTEAAKP